MVVLINQPKEFQMDTTTATEIVTSDDQVTEVVEVSLANRVIEALNTGDRLNLKMLAEKINELVTKVNELETKALSGKSTQTRNRGPVSEKVMTEDDARRAMIGDLKASSHKEAAQLLGLSYGQIYSARKGFTFKTIYKEMITAAKAE